MNKIESFRQIVMLAKNGFEKKKKKRMEGVLRVTVIQLLNYLVLTIYVLKYM